MSYINGEREDELERVIGVKKAIYDNMNDIDSFINTDNEDYQTGLSERIDINYRNAKSLDAAFTTFAAASGFVSI